VLLRPIPADYRRTEKSLGRYCNCPGACAPRESGGEFSGPVRATVATRFGGTAGGELTKRFRDCIKTL
jgi:hypothetical protein